MAAAVGARSARALWCEEAPWHVQSQLRSGCCFMPSTALAVHANMQVGAAIQHKCPLCPLCILHAILHVWPQTWLHCAVLAANHQQRHLMLAEA